MAAKRITIRIPATLSQKLRVCSRLKGQSESELVRGALEEYLDANTPNAYDAFKAAGLIGCVKGAPKDLSTNPRYMEGFGKSRWKKSW